MRIRELLRRRDRRLQRRRTRKATPSLRHPDLVEISRLITPIGDDLYKQPQVHLFSDQLLDIRPGIGADLLQLGAALADDDPFLGITLDVYRAEYARPLGIGFVPAFGY